MRKILVLLCVFALYLACDYATDNTKLYPDVEIVRISPIRWYTFIGDTTPAAMVDTTIFVVHNSVDCYLTKLIWTYHHEDGSMFSGPEEITLYMKITGKTNTKADTTKLLNVQIPLLPVQQNIPSGSQCRVMLNYVFVDEYWGSRYDTATAWYGIYVWPQ